MGGDSVIVEYVIEVGRFSLLSKEEEIELAKILEEGRKTASRASLEARERLITSNLRLVALIAKELFNKHHLSDNDLPDLIQEGNRALIKCIDLIGVKDEAGRSRGWDWRYGTKLCTYIVRAIRQKIERYILIENRRPAKANGFDFSEIENKEEVGAGNSGRCLANIIDALNKMASSGKILEEEKNILLQFYGVDGCREPVSLTKIGRSMGISQKEAKRLKDRALHCLREYFGAT